MIGKMTKGSNSGGLLNYCYYDKLKLSQKDKEKLTQNDVRGELIYIQNLAVNILKDGRFDIDDLANQINETAKLNQNLTDFVWHQSFSFPLDENPSSEILQGLIVDFIKDFGFEDNQVVAFKHSDKGHSHFHIVSNRINAIGKTTALDNYSKLRTGEFCRKSEIKYGLQATVNMTKLLPKKDRIERSSSSTLADELRNKIDTAITLSKSIEGFKAELNKNGVKVYTARGIAFVDKKTGSKVKGSSLGREYSLMYLQKRIADKSQRLMKPKDLSKATPQINSSTQPNLNAAKTNNMPTTLPKQNLATSKRPYSEDEDEEENEIKRQIRGIRR